MEGLKTYNIASGEVSDRILSSERDRAEHDEHQDEVGEYVMIYELVAKHAKPAGQREYSTARDLSGIRDTIQLCMCDACDVIVSYGFVVLKMKKALPSGIGVIFSFFTRSEMTGRGPDGTSGSSSSAAVSSMSSSSSLQSSVKFVSQYVTSQTVYDSVLGRN